MKIAINTRLLLKNNLDGIGRFTFEILKRITNNNPEVEFHFIFDRPFSPEFVFSKNIKTHILSPPTRHPILWYFWFEVRLPILIKKIKPDIFFSPDGFMPTKLSIPSIIVIHDINFEHRPKDLAWSHSWYYRNFFKKYAKLSSKIITVSYFSKKDIIKKYHINTKKIDVVYNGVSSVFKPINKTEKEEIKKKYSNNQEFFLFIGSLHKRKNIKNLLLAFDIYKKNEREKLIIIGRKKWWDKETESAYKKMKFKDDVIFLGKVSDKEMAKILASSTALCFISLFEGFGLPIIEAMKSEVPVITSNTSSMPEIAQNGALIVNPYDVNEITNAMRKITKDTMLRKDLINKAKQITRKFTWDEAANKINNIINNL